MTVKGFKEFKQRIDKLKKGIEEISGEQRVSIYDLFTPEFMVANTPYQDIDAMFEASGYKVENQQDFETIPDKEWNDFIRGNTQFSSWKDMAAIAGADWAKKKLGFTQKGQ